MRLKALILLLMFFMVVLMPVSINLTLTQDGTYIVSLDICKTAKGASSINSDHQYIVLSYKPLSYYPCCELYEIATPVFNPLLLPIRLEKPPRA